MCTRACVVSVSVGCAYACVAFPSRSLVSVYLFPWLSLPVHPSLSLSVSVSVSVSHSGQANFSSLPDSPPSPSLSFSLLLTRNPPHPPPLSVCLTVIVCLKLPSSPSFPHSSVDCSSKVFPHTLPSTFCSVKLSLTCKTLLSRILEHLHSRQNCGRDSMRSSHLAHSGRQGPEISLGALAAAEAACYKVLNCINLKLLNY